MTNVFFDSIMYTMNPETLNFLKHLIYDSNIVRRFDTTKTIYEITSDFGVSAQITETIVSEPNNNTARHYQIKLDNEIIIEAICDSKTTSHDPIVIQTKKLIQKCSDKLFYQEIQAHKQERMHNNKRQGK